MLDIQDIIEEEKTFKVPFTLFLSWNDSRLDYTNLNEETGLNLLSEDEKEKIWKPVVIFTNTNEKHKTKVDSETDIQIQKHGKATFTKTSNPENAKLYNGDGNPIIMQRYYREIFTCE